ncbi:Mitochondrial import inner membrane translocase subunit tim8 [Orbilia blumenaviensis]|uniref:Mitochondrial import inner membrane translocase subunit n=1 Tax=Orbilia blumenaviensis TaxID=1796055 RepID=A0AAV9VJ68_9PEZI
MDSSSGDINLTDLSQNDKKELQQFVSNEAQKAKIQSTVHYLTDMCWKRCITSKISSGQMDSYERPCMENCVDRYIDSQMTVLKHLEQLRGQL